jgi:hypothetical protein
MDEASIRAFEASLAIELPAEYVDFLLRSNGAACGYERAISLSNGEEVLCDFLFGLERNDALCVSFWLKELSGDLPERCVVIGSSPGGGFFLLQEIADRWSVWYYDHCHSFASSSDSENTYVCNIDLQDLLGIASLPLNA